MSHSPEVAEGPKQPTRPATLKSAFFGASSAAAAAVLVNVHIGVPAGQPIAFVLVSAMLGGAVGYLAASRTRMPKPPAIGALVAWGALVLSASVYVMAAIALSNLE